MRILIVDDRQDLSDTLCAVSRLLGHDAVAVTSGWAALEEARRARYDMILVDIVMPDMGGLEVIRRLRAIEPDARIVAMTGSRLDLASALAAIGVRFVPKPTTVDDVRALLAPFPPAPPAR
jgi:two-component system, OmpR family, response regulator